MSQCFLIKSKLTGFVLEAENGGTQPNSRVVPMDGNGRDNQIWYEDQATGTIRNKASQFCLDIENETLVVRPFQQGDPNQQWMRKDQHIRNRFDNNRVLDVMQNNRDKGAKVGAWSFNGGANQCWDFDFVGGSAPMGGGGGYPQTGATTYGGSGYPQAAGYPQSTGGYPSQQGGYPGQQSGYPGQQSGYPGQQSGYPGQQSGYPAQGGGYPAHGGHHEQGHGAQSGYPSAGGQSQPRREFFIVSEFNGKVLDIEGGKTEPGARVLMWEKHSPPKKNQLWYTDSQGLIKSALNDLPFSNSGNAEVLKIQAAQGDPRSQWTIEGNKLANRAGECADISRGHKDNGAEVISYAYKDQKNQHWRQEYV
jgi:hypothetical protein